MKTHSLKITPEMLSLIAEIDGFRGGWRSAHALTPERLASLRHVATIESIGSSTRIEGVSLSDEEIEGLLGKIGKTSFKTRDEQEVIGYAETIERVFESHEDIPFTENYLKQLHAMLLRHSSKDERHRGRYKKITNHVEAFDAEGRSLGVLFQTCTPFETPQEMTQLVDWTRRTLEESLLHPLIVIAIFNVLFLAIHPFQDGNGRLSRILVTLLLLKSNYSYVPYSSIESFIERNKESYYLCLRRTQATLKDEAPDWLPWLLFFMRTLKRQKDHLLIKMEERDGFSALPLDSTKILEYLTQHKRISIKEAMSLTQTPRATLKNRFNTLIEEGFIVRHGKGRGTWYAKV